MAVYNKEPEGEIGRQYIESASGCRHSPYVISPYPPRPMKALTTTPGTTAYVPYSLQTVSEFFNVPQSYLRIRVVRWDLRFIVLIQED